MQIFPILFFLLAGACVRAGFSHPGTNLLTKFVYSFLYLVGGLILCCAAAIPVEACVWIVMKLSGATNENASFIAWDKCGPIISYVLIIIGSVFLYCGWRCRQFDNPKY